MAFIIKNNGGGSTFMPAPEGMHRAVCVDLIDVGQQPDHFNPGKTVHKIDLVWQIDERRDDGKRFVIYKRYRPSLNEKATLRKDLESWRGRAMTRDDEMSFDLEQVIGTNCLLNIQHNVKGEKTYANVVAITPLMKGMQKLTALDYVRAEQPSAAVAQEEPELDDVPF